MARGFMKRHDLRSQGSVVLQSKLYRSDNPCDCKELGWHVGRKWRGQFEYPGIVRMSGLSRSDLVLRTVRSDLVLRTVGLLG
jgi:hypothetical protein